MKHLFILLSFLLVAFAASAQTIRYPFGDITTIASTDDTITVEIDVTNSVTYLDIASESLDASLTINADVSAEVKAGAILYVEATAKTGAKRALIFGTDIDLATDSVVAAKTNLYYFIYNGSTFKGVSKLQID